MKAELRAFIVMVLKLLASCSGRSTPMERTLGVY